MYIFYGIEIPKTWDAWYIHNEDLETIVDKNGEWEVDIPWEGGEPVLYKAKGVQMYGYDLTLYRYPFEENDENVIDSLWIENLGVIGFMICEIDYYEDPTREMDRWSGWRKIMHNPKKALEIDLQIQEMCRALDFNHIQPGYITTE